MNVTAGDTAFVTGGASGIGYGIAAAFADAGANVVLADIDGDRAVTAAAELATRNVATLGIGLDVTHRGGWRAAVDYTEDAVGPITLLCCNAGLAAFGWSAETLPPELWDRQIAVNLTGAFNGIREVVPRMKGRARPGHVVVTSSMSGLVARDSHIGYVASKHALVGLADALRIELRDTEIGVSVLCPASVATGLLATSEVQRRGLGVDVPADIPTDIGPDSRGLDPLDVGRTVLRAVRDRRFFIITHPEQRELALARFSELDKAFGTA